MILEEFGMWTLGPHVDQGPHSPEGRDGVGEGGGRRAGAYVGRETHQPTRSLKVPFAGAGGSRAQCFWLAPEGHFGGGARERGRNRTR